MKQEELPDRDEGNTSHEKGAKQDTNRIMGMAAIFISVLSMFAVIYQSYLAREGYKQMQIQQSATVVPYLDYWYSNVGDEYRFVIENKGVGPAFIKDVECVGVYSEKKDTIVFNNSNGLSDFINEQSTFLDSVAVIRNPIHENMLLSPEEEKAFFIFSFRDDSQKIQFGKEFYKYFGGLKITYEDVYGSEWILDSEKGYPVKLKK